MNIFDPVFIPKISYTILQVNPYLNSKIYKYEFIKFLFISLIKLKTKNDEIHLKASSSEGNEQ